MTLALLLIGCALTWAGRDAVQVAAGPAGLPSWWRLVEAAIVAMPVMAAWFQSPALALVSVVLGGLVFAVGRYSAHKVAEVVSVADVGARELQARKMLRRDSPPEMERIREPFTMSVDLDALEEQSRRQVRDCLRGADAARG